MSANTSAPKLVSTQEQNTSSKSMIPQTDTTLSNWWKYVPCFWCFLSHVFRNTSKADHTDALTLLFLCVWVHYGVRWALTVHNGPSDRWDKAMGFLWTCTLEKTGETDWSCSSNTPLSVFIWQGHFVSAQVKNSRVVFYQPSLTVAAPGRRTTVREPGGIDLKAHVWVQMRALHQLTTATPKASVSLQHRGSEE